MLRFKMKSQYGALGSEYGLLVGLVAVILIAAISSTGNRLSEIFALSAHEITAIPPGNDVAPVWSGNTISGQPLQYYALQNEIFLPSVTDSDGDNVTVSITGDLKGLTYDATQHALTGTPTESGLMTFTAAASDGEFTTDQDFTLEIETAPSYCADLVDSSYNIGTGSYLIVAEGNTPFSVECNMDHDNGGWTLVNQTTGGSRQIWTTNFNDLNYIYNELLVIFKSNHYMSYANDNRLKAWGSALPNTIRFRTKTNSWTNLSYDILRFAPSSRCRPTLDTNSPNYCAEIMKFSASGNSGFQSIGDSESISGSSSTDNTHILDFEIYVR